MALPLWGNKSCAVGVRHWRRSSPRSCRPPKLVFSITHAWPSVRDKIAPSSPGVRRTTSGFGPPAAKGTDECTLSKTEMPARSVRLPYRNECAKSAITGHRPPGCVSSFSLLRSWRSSPRGRCLNASLLSSSRRHRRGSPAASGCARARPGTRRACSSFYLHVPQCSDARRRAVRAHLLATASGGVYVHGLPGTARLVGSDRDQRQSKSSEAAARFDRVAANTEVRLAWITSVRRALLSPQPAPRGLFVGNPNVPWAPPGRTGSSGELREPFQVGACHQCRTPPTRSTPYRSDHGASIPAHEEKRAAYGIAARRLTDFHIHVEVIVWLWLPARRRFAALLPPRSAAATGAFVTRERPQSGCALRELRIGYHVS